PSASRLRHGPGGGGAGTRPGARRTAAWPGRGGGSRDGRRRLRRRASRPWADVWSASSPRRRRCSGLVVAEVDRGPEVRGGGDDAAGGRLDDRVLPLREHPDVRAVVLGADSLGGSESGEA